MLPPTDPHPAWMLSPATRLLWRAHDTVHLERGAHAVTVAGLPAPVIADLVAHRTAAGPNPPARPASRTGTAGPGATSIRPHLPPRGAIDAALTRLGEAGFLWPRDPRPPTARPPTEQIAPVAVHDDPRLAPPVPRLAGELVALSSRFGSDAAEVLAARRCSSVVLVGDGRLAAQLGAVLAASGVGRVRCAASGSARLRHAAPGGVLPHDEGRDLAAAAHDAVVRSAPEVDTAPLPTTERPDLVVLAGDTPVTEDFRRELHACHDAHLVVALGAEHGTVGPLVLPGLTSCLRCADLHRRDRDPGWPLLAAQLTIPRRHGPTSSVVVSTIVAGVAAMQVLAFLDGGDPATVEGTLEVRPPDWRVRRRTWPVHVACDCSAATDAENR